MTKSLKEAVARSVSILALYEEENGPLIGKMVLCPFHLDSNPSAKFYQDADGIDRLFCHSCKKQFTSYDWLLMKGLDPKAYLKEEVKPDEPTPEKTFNFVDLDGFRKGEFGIEEFLRRVARIGETNG